MHLPSASDAPDAKTPVANRQPKITGERRRVRKSPSRSASIASIGRSLTTATTLQSPSADSRAGSMVGEAALLDPDTGAPEDTGRNTDEVIRNRSMAKETVTLLIQIAFVIFSAKDYCMEVY